GHPDDKWGEVGCAHVILRQGKSADGAGLAAWCRSHLAAYKVPRHWVFAVDFPRTAAGKVQKHLLPGPGVAS
ncbi:MAG TPA: acid--CoA ligase, partial [Alphaproteobacteria bacterium]|nr:acid--CoA ligase [Alphaproteobacteria bacterium]